MLYYSQIFHMEEQLFKQKSVVVLTDVLKKLKTVSSYKSNVSPVL